jgi:hypothetical protein
MDTFYPLFLILLMQPRGRGRHICDFYCIFNKFQIIWGIGTLVEEHSPRNKILNGIHGCADRPNMLIPERSFNALFPALPMVVIATKNFNGVRN